MSCGDMASETKRPVGSPGTSRNTKKVTVTTTKKTATEWTTRREIQRRTFTRSVRLRSPPGWRGSELRRTRQSVGLSGRVVQPPLRIPFVSGSPQQLLGVVQRLIVPALQVRVAPVRERGRHRGGRQVGVALPDVLQDLLLRDHDAERLPE